MSTHIEVGSGPVRAIAKSPDTDLPSKRRVIRDVVDPWARRNSVGLRESEELIDKLAIAWAVYSPTLGGEAVSLIERLDQIDQACSAAEEAAEDASHAARDAYRELESIRRKLGLRSAA